MTTNNWESHCIELERELAELRGEKKDLETRLDDMWDELCELKQPKVSNKGKLSRELPAVEVFPCIMVQEDNLVELVRDFNVEVVVCMRGKDLRINIYNIYNPNDSDLSVAIGDIVYLDKGGNVRKYLESDGFFAIFESEGEK